jgi:hypothetical protein
MNVEPAAHPSRRVFDAALYLALAASVFRCSSGSIGSTDEGAGGSMLARVGSPPQGGAAAGDGSGSTGSGGAAGTGVATTGSGGATTGAGGATSGTGGATSGTGGATTGGGGATMGQGGQSGAGQMSSNDSGTSSGGKDGSGGSTGTGGAPNDGGTSTDPYAAARQTCVDRVNQLRASKGLPPYRRLTEGESCADNQAKLDSEKNQAHSAFGLCTNVTTWTSYGQNECPNYDSVASTLGGCIDAMWGEGPGGGHYDNIAGTYTKMACGFYTMPTGKVWMVQDFWK